jgi:integrase/recombinase XerD
VADCEPQNTRFRNQIETSRAPCFAARLCDTASARGHVSCRDCELPWAPRHEIRRSLCRLRREILGRSRENLPDGPCVTIGECAKRYVDRKRAQGLKFHKGQQMLRSFRRFLGDRELSEVTPAQVELFLSGPKTSTATWRHKYLCLRLFFEFWRARGELREVPLPQIRRPVPQLFVPHIYSRRQIELLVRATRKCRPPGSMIAWRTLRTFIIFLYATGARVGEARILKSEDVQLRKARVRFLNGRFGRTRCIPIGEDLTKLLQRYDDSVAGQRLGETFFVTRDGGSINDVTLGKAFQKLRRTAAVESWSSQVHPPRMHDLRHTFAVHRLMEWNRQGADLQRRLPALAAYMGLVGVTAAERYLSLTPDRFREHLAKLSLGKRTKRWRCDTKTILFLERL